MKRIAIALVLILLPVLVVHSVKKTDWGMARSAPAYRHKGDPKAPVVILEYSDFQCPACAHIAPTVNELLSKYEGKARFVFKHFPLRMHGNAMPAAEAAECAGSQEKFWPYHDRLYQTQSQWASLPSATTSFMAIAQEIGLNTPEFQSCLAEGRMRPMVLADAAEGQSRQIQSTPTFFVGSERLVGNYFASDGARMIERELRH